MEEHKFIAFLGKNWSKLLLALILVASFGLWTQRFLDKNKNKNNHDFFLAHQLLNRFQKGETLSLESTQAAEELVHRHPELYPKMGALLLISHLFHGENEKAQQDAAHSLSLAQAHLSPFYKSYAETSILITQKKYVEALIQAQELDTNLTDQPLFSTLQALNWLRLIFLYNETGDRQPFHQTWVKLQQHPLYPEIKSIFTEGKVTLDTYFQYLD